MDEYLSQMVEKQNAEDEFVNRMEGVEGYTNVRRLEDGTYVGLLKLMFTTAICIGLDDVGWRKRFCFEDMTTARGELSDLRTGEDEPEGWIARR